MLFILTTISELQVKVIPATEGQTVTLMCSTSCPRTENPAVYIWYKNREFLYEDWSPWYQELVSSEEAVTYSCAVKGYEDLRAPEVSVGESQQLQTLFVLFRLFLKTSVHQFIDDMSLVLFRFSHSALLYCDLR